MSIKQTIKSQIGNLLETTGVFPLRRKVTGQKHLVVTFHRIRENSTPLDQFDTCPSHSVQNFRYVLEYLAKRFKVIPLGEMPSNWDQTTPQASITFDDGWRDNFELAFPILKKMGLPATIFVTTDKIGSNVAFWQQILGNAFRRASLVEGKVVRERLGSLFGLPEKAIYSPDLYRSIVERVKCSEDQINLLQAIQKLPDLGHNQSNYRFFLDREEIKTLYANGIDIGSHTNSHALLDSLENNEIEKELVGSKAVLECIIGSSIKTIAYPNGRHNSTVLSIAATEGYEVGVSTVARRCRPGDSPLLIPRIEPAWDFEDERTWLNIGSCHWNFS